MGDFLTHISKCSESKTNFFDFFHVHPQQKVLKGQKFSGMGLPNNIVIKGQECTAVRCTPPPGPGAS